jgi:hypothetical protein
LQQKHRLLSTASSGPATLAVAASTDANNSMSHVVGGHLLEEATEFEFMRNILYKYMLGRENDSSLAKVNLFFKAK